MNLQEKLADIVRLQEAATGGPWEAVKDHIRDRESHKPVLTVVNYLNYRATNEDNASFIAAARNFPFAELAKLLEPPKPLTVVPVQPQESTDANENG